MSNRYISDRYIGNTKYNEYNFTERANNNYQENFQEKGIQPSINHENNIKYNKREEYIIISSADRDITKHPNPNHYTINLPYELKNLSSIEIINGVIPDKNNVLQEPYLLLKIDELDNIMISNNKAVSNSFAILHLCNAIKPGYFVNVDKKTFEHVVLNFITPKASLSKLTITITDYNGRPFDFGNDSGGPNKELQNMFVLKAVILEKSRDNLNQRNVY